MTQENNRAPRLLAPGEGKSFSMMGIRITPKITGEESGGAYTLIEQVVQAGGGSPPHICHRDDKTIYVVDGEFDILLGDQPRRATAGACAIIPRGTVHNFRNVGTREGKLLVALTPAGHEKFLEEMARLSQAGTPDLQELKQLCDARGVEILRR